MNSDFKKFYTQSRAVYSLLDMLFMLQIVAANSYWDAKKELPTFMRKF